MSDDLKDTLFGCLVFLAAIAVLFVSIAVAFGGSARIRAHEITLAEIEHNCIMKEKERE